MVNVLWPKLTGHGAVLPGLLLATAYIALEASFIRLEAAGLGAPTLYSLLVIHGAFVCFVIVAVWASSANYTGRTLWKVLARIAVFAGAILYVNVIVETFSPPDPLSARE